MAVYRGKMSEGVDFKDAYCRAVFCVGIPFPSAKDNRINYKVFVLHQHPMMHRGLILSFTLVL